MKTTEVVTQLKKMIGVSRNDEIVPAIEAAISAASAPPFGAMVIISAGGQITSSPFGLSNPPTLQEISNLQQAFRMLANSMDEQKMETVRREAMAKKADAPT